MKPCVICLMHSSRDGRTHPSRWRPLASTRQLGLLLRYLIENAPPAAAR